MEVVLLGKQIEAAEAHAAGLVAGIYEPGTVLDATLAAATQLATKSSTAVALSKEAIKRGK
jgi:enoyl-CoA hydratase/carnithine racemase